MPGAGPAGAWYTGSLPRLGVGVRARNEKRDAQISKRFYADRISNCDADNWSAHGRYYGWSGAD